jgi:hypothetical protein
MSFFQFDGYSLKGNYLKQNLKMVQMKEMEYP